jgi:hypothetical protein
MNNEITHNDQNKEFTNNFYSLYFYYFSFDETERECIMKELSISLFFKLKNEYDLLAKKTSASSIIFNIIITDYMF